MAGYYYGAPADGYAYPRAIPVAAGPGAPARIAVPLAPIAQPVPVRSVYIAQPTPVRPVYNYVAQPAPVTRPVQLQYANPQAPYYLAPAVPQQPVVVNNAAVPRLPAGIPNGSRIVKIPASALPQAPVQPQRVGAGVGAAVTAEDRRLDALVREDMMAREQLQWYHTRRPISPTFYGR